MNRKVRKISTIEDLALLMQAEFLVLHEKFEGADKRFEQVDQKFLELKAEFIDDVDELEGKIRSIDTRTQNQVDSVYDDTSVLKTDVKEAKEDIVLIKKHVGMTA